MVAFFALDLATADAGAGKHYGIAIASGKTHNVKFANGVFTPKGDHAVLNVSDLENALASGNVEITTGNGSGGALPGDINVDDSFTWTGSSSLTLDAYHSVYVNQPVADAGSGALALITDDGGTSGALFFGATGNIAIWGLSTPLTINGKGYTLVGDLQTLADDVAKAPSGLYALANSYDAKRDGVYSAAPVTTTFSGTFEGLGNTISKLTIADTADNLAGLFASGNGVISDIGLVGVHVTLNAASGSAGALAANGNGVIRGSYSTGSVTASGSATAGGLIGTAGGAIANSHSSATVQSGDYSKVGGLVGSFDGASLDNSYATGAATAGVNSFAGGLAGYVASGTVEGCFATGTATIGDVVSGQRGAGSAGGLIGVTTNSQGNSALIEDSYATGNAAGGTNSEIGGFIGQAYIGTFQSSYSLGVPSAGQKSLVGGFLGLENANAGATSTYWDTTTSGTTTPVGKGSGAGILGLTTAQFQSALPSGFDPGIWAESPPINNGLPYLIANPPPQ
jgi:hypothetical protein